MLESHNVVVSTYLVAGWFITDVDLEFQAEEVILDEVSIQSFNSGLIVVIIYPWSFGKIVHFEASKSEFSFDSIFGLFEPSLNHGPVIEINGVLLDHF